MHLQEVKLHYVNFALKLNGGNRVQTAKYLGISLRGLRNQINKFKEYKITEERPIEEVVSPEGIVFKFPTNEERLQYLDNRK